MVIRKKKARHISRSPLSVRREKKEESVFDGRIQRLEETGYFQEKLLRELNGIVTEQASEIERLKGEIEELRTKVIFLQERIDGKMEDARPLYPLLSGSH